MTDTNIRFGIFADDRFAQTFANLRRDLTLTRERVTGITAAASTVLRIGSLGAVAGVGAMGLAFRNLANDLNTLNDASDATGSTVEKISGLEDIARRNGGDLNLVTSAIVKMNEALLAAKPDSPVSKALKAIGLDAAELRKLDPSEALLRIARALAEYENDGNKARLVQQLFGKSLREVAPLLGDLAAAGTINAKVTAEQAAEAKKFTSALDDLSTNASNAARALASELLPSINGLFRQNKVGNDVFGGILGQLRAFAIEGRFEDPIEGATHYGNVVRQLDEDVKRLRASGEGAFSVGLSVTQNDLFKARKYLDYYQQLAVAAGKFAGGGRGFVNPELPAPKQLPDVVTGTGDTAKTTEAQRLLDTLVRQREQLELQLSTSSALEKISALDQLNLDLKAKRIDGITPAIERQLRAESKRLDVARELDKLKERELGFQKLIADAEQRSINDGLALLEQTPTGRAEKINLQVDQVLRVSRANPDDAATQRKASEAIARLRKDLDELDAKTDTAGDGFTRLADTIDKSMDRATGALLDFAIEGKGDFTDIGKAIARDLARGLLEEPIQDEIKALGLSISNTLRDALKGKDIFGEITTFLDSLKDFDFGKLFSGGDSGGGGWGSLLGSIASSFFGGGTTRANGGSVRAGQLVKWKENGTEYFVPGQDGTVVTDAQARRNGGGQAPTVTQVFNLQGDISPQTVALVQAMIDRSNARLLRGMRTGGATVG
jgi:hypothetical protein